MATGNPLLINARFRSCGGSRCVSAPEGCLGPSLINVLLCQPLTFSSSNVSTVVHFLVRYLFLNCLPIQCHLWNMKGEWVRKSCGKSKFNEWHSREGKQSTNGIINFRLKQLFCRRVKRWINEKVYACALNDKLIHHQIHCSLFRFRQKTRERNVKFIVEQQKKEKKAKARDDLIENIWRWNFSSLFASLSSVFIVHSSLHNCHWLTSQPSRSSRSRNSRDLLSKCLWFISVDFTYGCCCCCWMFWKSGSLELIWLTSAKTQPDDDRNRRFLLIFSSL